MRALCGGLYCADSQAWAPFSWPSASGGAGRALAAGPAVATAADGARVTGERWSGGRDLAVSSPAPDTTAPVRVLLPRGWSRSVTRTWPVVYAYHGGRDTYVSWTRSRYIEQLAAGYGVMVAMPDTGFAGWFAD